MRHVFYHLNCSQIPDQTPHRDQFTEFAGPIQQSIPPSSNLSREFSRYFPNIQGKITFMELCLKPRCKL